MDQYLLTLTGMTPLIMHQDNLSFSEKIRAWQKDPANKEFSVAGDDRSPAWTWLGYVYHNRKSLGIPSDNIMTVLREGGAKVKTGKGTETYKKLSQSGIIVDQEQFDLLVNGKKIAVEGLNSLIGNREFNDHLEAAENAGFELFVKRAGVNRKKHVRVRPMFREWMAMGTITVIDSEVSGITQDILERILNQAGALCGLCDWRPSSPTSSGTFGKFAPTLELIKQ